MADAIQIFAIDKKDGERQDITDLYWFEENYVHGWDGEGYGEDYHFEIFVYGVKVYPLSPEVQNRLAELKK